MSELLKEENLELEEDELEDAIVLDDPSAEMMIARIQEANDQFDRLAEWYKHQLEKAKAIRDRTIEYATRSLQGYFGMVPYKQTKTQKTYELPGATLVLKHQEPKYEVDDKAMVPWLEKNGMTDSVKTNVEKTAAWGELKKVLTKTQDGNYVTEDGECLPGLKVTQRPDDFQIKLKGKK